jgi:hypothetical protein
MREYEKQLEKQNRQLMEQRASDNKLIEELLYGVNRYRVAFDHLLRELNFDVDADKFCNQKFEVTRIPPNNDKTRSSIIEKIRESLEPDGLCYTTTDNVENVFRFILKELDLYGWDKVKELENRFNGELEDDLCREA